MAAPATAESSQRGGSYHNGLIQPFINSAGYR